MEIFCSSREVAGHYGVRQILGQRGEEIQLSSARWKPLLDLVNSTSARAYPHEEQRIAERCVERVGYRAHHVQSASRLDLRG